MSDNRRNSSASRVYTVAMYNADGIVMRFDDTVAVSAAQAINNVRWRWRGVEGVHYEIAQRSAPCGEVCAE